MAQAFAAMCKSWGLPRQLYLDNGIEYGWHEMMDGFAQLSRLSGPALDARLTATAGGAVVRARPYNAPANPIEGIFALLEQQVLCMLPGWIGGDRMRAKIHNVGRRPRTYPGAWAVLHDSFDRALAYYHARAQAQREQRMKRHIQDLRQNTVRLELEQAMQRRRSLARPAPELPRGPVIALTPAIQHMLDAMNTQQSPPPKQHRLLPSGASLVSQWSARPNPLLAALDPSTLLDERYDAVGGKS